jgi:hypothetical protein
VSVEYLELADYLAIASGDWSQDDMATWLRGHLSSQPSGKMHNDKAPARTVSDEFPRGRWSYFK